MWEFRSSRRPHMCTLPEASAPDIPTGSVWRCDVCSRRWQVVLPATTTEIPDHYLVFGERRGPDRAVWHRISWWHHRF